LALTTGVITVSGVPSTARGDSDGLISALTSALESLASARPAVTNAFDPPPTDSSTSPTDGHVAASIDVSFDDPGLADEEAAPAPIVSPPETSALVEAVTPPAAAFAFAAPESSEDEQEEDRAGAED